MAIWVSYIFRLVTYAVKTKPPPVGWTWTCRLNPFGLSTRKHTKKNSQTSSLLASSTLTIFGTVQRTNSPLRERKSRSGIFLYKKFSALYEGGESLGTSLAGRTFETLFSESVSKNILHPLRSPHRRPNLFSS